MVLPVSLLKGGCITDGDIAKLKKAGFVTVESVARSPRKHLIAINGISELKADKLLESACGQVSMGITTAGAVLAHRYAAIRIRTGSNELDKLLGGGVEVGSITELVGESRTGKTQLCHSLAVSSLAGDNGSTQVKSIFIDTCNSFYPARLIASSDKFGLTPDSVTDNVIYARGYNTDHLVTLVCGAYAHATENNIRLVVIDSLMKLFRTDFCGRGELAERQQMLSKCLRFLQRLAEDHQLAVVVTNEMIANVNGLPFEPKMNPAGGHVLAHMVTTRVSLRKLAKENRCARIEKSPCLSNTEALFAIGEDGIRDVVEQ